MLAVLSINSSSLQAGNRADAENSDRCFDSLAKVVQNVFNQATKAVYMYARHAFVSHVDYDQEGNVLYTEYDREGNVVYSESCPLDEIDSSLFITDKPIRKMKTDIEIGRAIDQLEEAVDIDAEEKNVTYLRFYFN